MKFAYEDLSESQFEDLVIFICQKLLGVTVQGFSQGPDGGRDAKFIGTAECCPSKNKPWTGTTIIQAKHTNGYNKNFAESDFFSVSSKSTIIEKEIPRIVKLRENKQLDNYMLFSNRRLSAITENEIQAHLSDKCDIPIESVKLYGVEQIEIYMKTFPDIAENLDIDPIDSPLIVSPDELSEVIQAFSKNIDKLSETLDDPPTPRIPYSTKNEINNMSEEYAKSFRDKYLKETIQIGEFLAAPENREFLKMYESVIDEFELKIISKRKDYQTFDEVIEHLSKLLVTRDPILRQRKHKRLTKAFIFYMYWHCDIGQTD